MLCTPLSSTLSIIQNRSVESSSSSPIQVFPAGKPPFRPKPLFFAEDDDDFSTVSISSNLARPYELFDTVTDLIQIKKTTPFCSSYKRITAESGVNSTCRASLTASLRWSSASIAS
ncbi:hypothetical protein CK203_098625 [Vitis vinifera]|uniref:Uncharacterized protein n=1 Tax=Vitis vinifera TaxID=29760 RepID=A0A438CM87_VITVI|nr:hypothetical protein CK203_098625 [Vitis vinifera]